MNDPRIPALLVSHHRPGFYLRVLGEGEVKAGDEILKLESGPEQMSVAEVSALLYLPGHSRQQLLRALRIPALSPGWQESFRALLDGQADRGNAGLTTASPPPAWTGFRVLAVTAIELESDSVISIRLEDPAASRCGRPPGQNLTLRIKPENAERALLRNYSLCVRPRPATTESRSSTNPTAPSAATSTNGSPSATTRSRRTARDVHSRRVRCTGAADQRRRRRHTGAGDAQRAGRSEFPAGGLVAPQRAQRPRALVCARDAHSARGPLAHPQSHLLQPAGQGGRRRSRLRHRRAPHPSLLLELEPPQSAEAYICGPSGFMDDISAGLASIGVNPSHIHTEPFGPEAGSTPGIASKPARAPHPPAGSRAEGPTIEFAAATSPCRGAATTPVCSSSPRHATSRSAGRAGRAYATPAKAR